MRYFAFLLGLMVFIGNNGVSAALPVIDRSHIDAANKNAANELEAKRRQSEESTNATVAQTGEHAKHVTAGNMNDSKRSQEVEMVNTAKRHMEKPEYACSYITVSGNLSGGIESASQSISMKLEERLKVIASEAGSKSSNGLVDFQNQLFDEMQGLGTTRFSIGNLLNTPNIPQSGAIATQLEYLQNMLYARVPVYLNKDLMDNPDTEVKNLSIQADRLRSEMSIGQTVFSILEGMRAPNQAGGNAIQFLKQITKANKFSDEWQQKVLPNNASYRAQLEGLALGQFGQGYMKEKFINTPENIPIGILFNSMLTNVLLFEQYRLLETIAAATSTQIIATREEAIKDVNARIARKNARQ